MGTAARRPGEPGEAVAGATVALHSYNADTERWTSVADGKTDATGRFELTTYAKFDGVPVGEYAVTVTKAAPALASPTTTTLKVRITESPHTLNLDLP